MAVIYELDLVLARTRLTNSVSSRPAYVTYACADDVSAHNPLAAANAIQDAFADIWQPQLDSNVTIGPTSVLVGLGTSIGMVSDSTIANVAGTNAAASPPANTAMLMKKTTGVSGRANRGRMYLPWFGDEATVDEGGTIAGASVTAAQTRATAWLARLTTDNYPLIIANRVYDLPWDNPARQLTAVNGGPLVTAVVVQALCGTQRRRMRS